MLNGKPLDKITEADIQGLVERCAREGRHVEFKRELPGSSDKERAEFVADVSAFANATGGDLFYGVEDSDGVATAVLGVAPENADKEILRLEGIIHTGLDPTLVGVRVQPIGKFKNGPVIVVRIPPSFSAPHMVTVKRKQTEFYLRGSAGKSPMDVVELRSAFLQSGEIAEKARRFLEDRLSRVRLCETPVSMADGPKIVLHVLSLSSLLLRQRVDVALHERTLQDRLRMLQCPPGRDRFNLDGYVAYYQGYEEPHTEAYAQLFTSGTIESVNGGILTGGGASKELWGGSTEDVVLKALRGYVMLLHELGVLGPFFVKLSFLDVRGFRMGVPAHHLRIGSRDSLLVQQDLLLPDVEIQSSEGLEREMRPVFDDLWRAFGYPRSRSYDAEGNWSAPR